ncbi:NfeD family protein [Thalassospira sp. SM2505]|uniref:NfeD family protein n=1 Tax=Thalassospira sp. CH_XMU1448-2 TaxID=3107773 RepID=UPI00300836FF
MDMFSNLAVEFWHWWILACVFLVLEMVLPGIIFLWLSIAAAIAGIILLIVPDISPEFQLIAFGVLSVIAVLVGRRFLKPGRSGTTDEDVSSASSSLVGKTAILTEKTVNGQIRQSVYGSSWVLVAERDLPKGQKVRVSAVSGSKLLIEPVMTDPEET